MAPFSKEIEFVDVTVLRASALGTETTAPVLTLALVSILFKDKARILARPSSPKSPVTKADAFSPKRILEFCVCVASEKPTAAERPPPPEKLKLSPDIPVFPSRLFVTTFS